MVVCWPVSRGHRFDGRHRHTSLKPEYIARERHCAGKGLCLVLVHGHRDLLVCIFVCPFNARSVLQLRGPEYKFPVMQAAVMSVVTGRRLVVRDALELNLN